MAREHNTLLSCPLIKRFPHVVSEGPKIKYDQRISLMRATSVTIPHRWPESPPSNCNRYHFYRRCIKSRSVFIIIIICRSSNSGVVYRFIIIVFQSNYYILYYSMCFRANTALQCRAINVVEVIIYDCCTVKTITSTRIVIVHVKTFKI